MTHGKTYNKSPRRINHKATKSKTNTALSETRLAEEGLLKEVGAGYTFFWSGREKEERREAGKDSPSSHTSSASSQDFQKA